MMDFHRGEFVAQITADRQMYHKRHNNSALTEFLITGLISTLAT